MRLKGHVEICGANGRWHSTLARSALRDLFGLRLVLRCNNAPRASNTILAQGWARFGHSAATIAPGERRIGLLLPEDATSIRMRCCCLADDELDQLAARANALAQSEEVET